jgi:hypothetical protein
LVSSNARGTEKKTQTKTFQNGKNAVAKHWKIHFCQAYSLSHFATKIRSNIGEYLGIAA